MQRTAGELRVAIVNEFFSEVVSFLYCLWSLVRFRGITTHLFGYSLRVEHRHSLLGLNIIGNMRRNIGYRFVWVCWYFLLFYLLFDSYFYQSRVHNWCFVLFAGRTGWFAVRCKNGSWGEDGMGNW